MEWDVRAWTEEVQHEVIHVFWELSEHFFNKLANELVHRRAFSKIFQQMITLALWVSTRTDCRSPSKPIGVAGPELFGTKVGEAKALLRDFQYFCFADVGCILVVVERHQ